MTWWQKLRLRLRALFQKEKLDARMDEEMRSHIEMQTQENIEAGMQPEEAHYAAFRQFGWVESIKETCRDQRGVSWIENLGQDVRYGARILRKNPCFTAVALFTLALGIGANTAMFSMVNTVLLQPLPYGQPERLVRLFERYKEEGWERSPVAPANFLDWRTQNTVFESIAATQWSSFNVTGGGEPERLLGLRVSASLFPVLGVNPILGRYFTAEEDQFG